MYSLLLIFEKAFSEEVAHTWFTHAEAARRVLSHIIRTKKAGHHCSPSTATAMTTADMAGMPIRPSALGRYEDWPAYAARKHFAAGSPSAQQLVDTLGVPPTATVPEYRVGTETKHDGVITTRLSWQLGFGPRTSAWFVRPTGITDPLPGILALHCHGGIKSHGAERLVLLPGDEGNDAGATAPVGFGPVPAQLREKLYGGRPMATWLAQQGFAVLAHDAFMWGSRGFDLENQPWRTARAVDGQHALWREAGVEPSAADLYNAAAADHEETVAKAATLLGTSIAGTVAHDDLAALGVLASLPGVDPERLGCTGFSGGGGRAMVLAALSPLIRSYVVTCMMTTFASLLPAYLDAHSWLLHSPGLSKLGDWPDLVVRSTAGAVLVQYALADQLFPEAGMRDADAHLSQRMPPGRYTGSVWPGPHVFSTAMQEEAAAFLSSTLQANEAPGFPSTDPARTAL